MAPPYPGVLLCEPKFAPNPGNENIEGYFAVVSESWKGIVTSEHALIQMLNKHTPTRTFKADTKFRILELWVQDCTKYHNHEGEVPESRAAAYDCTLPSSPPPSASCSPPSSLPSSPFSATNSTDSRVSSPMATPSPSPTKADAVICEDAREALLVLPMLYAVGGHQHILSDWEKAIDLFKRTPGAELAFRHTTVEIWAFLGDNSVRRRVLPKSVQVVPRMYAVSRHKRVFQDRDRAVALLQSSLGAKLTYSYDANEIWVFLAAGGLTT
ncbi:hypothetical protein B0H13DRAFT_1919508 [Mycena leptocephala]|nr:hypothetical protein B0H13DRAFT_1919508 [Mycena leptocephala]